MRREEPEAFPKQSAGTVPFDRKKTVFLPADYAAFKFSVRRRCNNSQHSSADLLAPRLTNQVKFGLQAEMRQFSRRPPSFRHGNQAVVRRARPF